jgi:hypothetical protein
MDSDWQEDTIRDYLYVQDETNRGVLLPSLVLGSECLLLGVGRNEFLYSIAR